MEGIEWDRAASYLHFARSHLLINISFLCFLIVFSCCLLLLANIKKGGLVGVVGLSGHGTGWLACWVNGWLARIAIEMKNNNQMFSSLSVVDRAFVSLPVPCASFYACLLA